VCVSTRERNQFPSVLLQPLGHLSVYLTSTVYGPVAEPETSNCVRTVSDALMSCDHLRRFGPAARPRSVRHNRPTPALQDRTQGGIPARLKPLILNQRCCVQARMRPYSAVVLSRSSHVTTSTPCASASLRNLRQYGRDALRQQRLERGELGAFPFTNVPWSVAADAHRAGLSRGHRTPVGGWLIPPLINSQLHARACALQRAPSSHPTPATSL
jgi:hypothetical protein